jgi:ribonuclease R
MEERVEYRWYMNEQKKIDHIEQHEKLLSQKLVEECMVAANRCCARFLEQHSCSGPFVRHRGFRADRAKETANFIKRFLPAYVEKSLDELDTYRAIMKELSDPAQALPLRSMVNRLLARAELDTRPGPHMGMGLPVYSNCTSPLRKYVDYLAHRQIKRVLHDESREQVSGPLLVKLSQRLKRARTASQEAEQWLKCEFLSHKVGTEFQAVISQVNGSGFTAKLLENGIEGTVDLSKDPEKFSFDRWTASLTSPTRSYRLNSEIRVKLVSAHPHEREIRLSPLPPQATDAETDSPAAPVEPTQDPSPAEHDGAAEKQGQTSEGL